MHDLVGQHHDSCWEFVRAYYATIDIDIPAEALSTQGFVEVEHPRNGDLVIIDLGVHCGLYHNQHVAHHVDNFGVVINRADQFYKTSYYRYCGGDT